MLLYVDDIVLFGKTERKIKNVIELLEKCFDLKLFAKNTKLLSVEFSEYKLEPVTSFCLIKRRHDMGNSLGDETSCESITPLTYLTLNVLAPNGQCVLR